MAGPQHPSVFDLAKAPLTPGYTTASTKQAQINQQTNGQQEQATKAAKGVTHGHRPAIGQRCGGQQDDAQQWPDPDPSKRRQHKGWGEQPQQKENDARSQ